ncbi:DUF3811 domain-containing protein [Pectobacterium parmentieri]|uniref:DUF3811 domain-containing protein n=1 Tax=Pectobacterium parmentieri TaxID=1905730 RepID=UPI0027D22010|nr:DUF3811 domain-containing protein [Pectobacterium parmentieri]
MEVIPVQEGLEVFPAEDSARVKDDYIDKLMKEREAVAKQARAEKKKNKFKPDSSTTYEWSANTNLRGRR